MRIATWELLSYIKETTRGLWFTSGKHYDCSLKIGALLK